MRKSKKIGQIIKGHLILDSFHIDTDTKFKLRCVKCGTESIKSSGFLKAKGACPVCMNGKNYHNAKGHEHERLYERYMSMLRRVKSHESYRGIYVCEAWVNDYLKFKEWALNSGYDDSLTIDRIDNSKGYSPENCRWATAKQQANNRKSNVVLEYMGEKITLSELADRLSLPYYVVQQRHKYKWSVEKIVNTPYKRKNGKEKTSNNVCSNRNA